MWISYRIRRGIIRLFRLKLSTLKILETFIIATGSFAISITVPMVFGFDKLVIICIMSVLLIHELGHFCTMKYFKCKNTRIMFFWIIGITTTSSVVKSRINRTVISMAGPVPGIVLGSALLILYRDLSEEIMFFAESLVVINFFNVIPIAILDGGHIFESLFIPNSNKKIGIFNFITGTGSFIFCFLNKDYFILWLCIIIILRGIIFLRHRKEPPIIELDGFIKPKQKILITVIWVGAIFVGLVSII